jgi:hypothetical protein
MRSSIERTLVERLRKLGAAAASVDFGVPEPSETTPKPDGTAAPGTEYAYARGDHVHPRDEVKADVEREIITVNIGSFSSLPKTVSNAAIKAAHTVLAYTLGTPSAQTGDWQVGTAAGSLTITGSISGSTTMKIILGLVGSSI